MAMIVAMITGPSEAGGGAGLIFAPKRVESLLLAKPADRGLITDPATLAAKVHQLFRRPRGDAGRRHVSGVFQGSPRHAQHEPVRSSTNDYFAPPHFLGFALMFKSQIWPKMPGASVSAASVSRKNGGNTSVVGACWRHSLLIRGWYRQARAGRSSNHESIYVYVALPDGTPL